MSFVRGTGLHIIVLFPAIISFWGGKEKKKKKEKHSLRALTNTWKRINMLGTRPALGGGPAGAGHGAPTLTFSFASSVRLSDHLTP